MLKNKNITWVSLQNTLTFWGTFLGTVCVPALWYSTPVILCLKPPRNGLWKSDFIISTATAWYWSIPEETWRSLNGSSTTKGPRNTSPKRHQPTDRFVLWRLWLERHHWSYVFFWLDTNLEGQKTFPLVQRPVAWFHVVAESRCF